MSACALALLLSFASAAASAQTGVQVNVHPITGQDIIGDAGNEPSLAVSPVNPGSIVIGWRSFPSSGSDSRYAGYAWSLDGGATFTSGGVLPAPPGYPATAEQTDPVLAVDSLGVYYYWSEVFRPGFGNVLYQSADFGQTWPAVSDVETVVTSGDKGWLTVDRSGGPGDGHLYGGWNNFSLGGQCFVRSTDGGQSFSPPLRIADRGGTQWMLQYAVGPSGELYAAWRHYGDNAIYVTKSDNAWDANVATTFNAFGNGGNAGLDLEVDSSNDPGFLDINPVGFHQLYLDVDRSNGPRSGWVYCLWADDRYDGSDVILARSSDGGFSWDSGIRVNDDVLGSGDLQWMPAMSVAPDGRIDAVWYDTRNDPGDPLPDSELYYSFSLDGGSTWSVDRRASDAFNTTAGWPQQQKIGDYIQCASQTGSVHVAYAATFNGGQDIWYLNVKPTLLSVRNLVAGQTATAALKGARPNAPAWLAVSLTGLGSTYVAALNATLGLANPFQIGGQKQSNALGESTWQLGVPPGASGLNLWIQAIQMENGSNLLALQVQ